MNPSVDTGIVTRRDCLKSLFVSASAIGFGAPFLGFSDESDVLTRAGLKLAVQQYTFNRQLRSGELKIEDYPRTVVEGTGMKALEYYNGHMMDRAKDRKLFRGLKKTCDDLGAVNTMMLLKSNNALDSKKAEIRKAAVEEYKPWLEAMKVLGGFCVRVDVRSSGDYEEQLKHAADGLNQLCDVAEKMGLQIVVENHGGWSSNGEWVAKLMKKVGRDSCGTLPDFQNFKDYDPYKGVEEMMPWAKIVCAKAIEFNEAGNEVRVDYGRMFRIVKKAGFKGYVGIEFEGHDVDPVKGILITKALIERSVAAA